MSKKQINDYLPLTPASYQILLALSGKKDLHGYGIMKEAEEESGERIPNPTLYRSLTKLVDAKLVEVAREDDEGRRFYKITGFGSKVVSAQARHFQRLANQARDKQIAISWLTLEEVA